MATPKLTEPSLKPLGRQGNGGSGSFCEADREAILEQLERILASAAFRNSKRYSKLLQHVVNRALDGHPEDLKERTIGVDVFGRAPDYDTNTDHVVRSVAGEVRRRLAQYYMESGHEGEIRIELLPGCYIPQFRLPKEEAVETAVADVTLPKSLPWRTVFLSGFLVLAALAGVIAVRSRLEVQAFDRFWNPFLASPHTVLVCVGGGGQSSSVSGAGEPLSVRDFERQPSRRIHISDALALAGLTGMLRANGKPYRLLNRARATTFRDLQSGPFILIGAMNNEWTLRLTSAFRFGFERQPNGARVVDRWNPSKNDWSVDAATPLDQFTRDYAIVSRVRDPHTEQVAVIVAGILSWGTLAAAEFVTSPEHLKKLEALAPKNWEQKNVEVVISTDIIRGSSGPPNVVAAHFW
jgi:hypothetical protein